MRVVTTQLERECHAGRRGEDASCACCELPSPRTGAVEPLVCNYVTYVTCVAHAVCWKPPPRTGAVEPLVSLHEAKGSVVHRQTRQQAVVGVHVTLAVAHTQPLSDEYRLPLRDLTCQVRVVRMMKLLPLDEHGSEMMRYSRALDGRRHYAQSIRTIRMPSASHAGFQPRRRV